MNWLSLLQVSSVLQGPLAQADTTPTAAATGAVTATATLTTAVEPTLTPLVVTPPPVATPPVAGTLASNPFDPDFLLRAADSSLGPFSISFLALSLIVLGIGAYFYFFAKERWRRTQPAKFRAANTWGLFALVLGGLGVLFVVFRILSIPGLNIHFWLYILGLVYLGFTVYAIYYFIVEYPRQLSATSTSKKGGSRAVRATARTRGAAPPPSSAAGQPTAPKGSAGNPRGTSARGERRRAKK